MADTIYYGESQLMFGDIEIVCESFKISFKMDSEDLTATNSSTAYGTQFGKETVEAEASGIDPALRKPLKKQWNKKLKIFLLHTILKKLPEISLKMMYCMGHMLRN